MNHLKAAHHIPRTCLPPMAVALALLAMFACSGSEVDARSHRAVGNVGYLNSHKSDKGLDTARQRPGTLRRYLEKQCFPRKSCVRSLRRATR